MDAPWEPASPAGIGDWPHRRRVKSAGVPALIFGEADLTYDALAARVDRLANALHDRGVREGDRVAYLGNNHPAFVETLFGVTLLGAILVPLNTRLSVPELAYMLRDSSARSLFFAGDLEERARAAAREAGGVDVVAVEGAGPDGMAALTSAGARTHPPCHATLDDPALIIYTSGTTGRPKGAVLTHGNLTWNAFNVLVDYDVTSEGRALMISPLFHVASLGMGLLPVLLKGGTVVLAERFLPGEALRLIERHRITSLSGVPTTYQLLMEDPAWARTDLSSLRSLTCGGSAVPARVRQAYEARGLAFSSGYGLTETSPGATSLSPRYSVTKGETSGLPHFFTDVRVEPESGEVEVRGPNVFAGYWENPEATQAAFTDGGWLRTGDLGRLDDEGFLTIVDRAKDLIVSGGENVYPAEVELAIMTFPDVTGVAVIGVPDERWGEVPHAVLTLRPGATLVQAEFVDYLSQRLARYKVPRTFEVVDELPRTASGKLQKHLLRRARRQ
ncbi:MAG: long-chain fatty acid--CoA ligase [Candidatus Dormibacteraeota bacterium]|nr:long-chain fatty acid--CoA ligase [Candidatus Dormibacteraeota bacterium]